MSRKKRPPRQPEAAGVGMEPGAEMDEALLSGGAPAGGGLAASIAEAALKQTEALDGGAAGIEGSLKGGTPKAGASAGGRAKTGRPDNQSGVSARDLLRKQLAAETRRERTHGPAPLLRRTGHR